jgi:hypothetical protein
MAEIPRRFIQAWQCLQCLPSQEAREVRRCAILLSGPERIRKRRRDKKTPIRRLWPEQGYLSQMFPDPS